MAEDQEGASSQGDSPWAPGYDEADLTRIAPPGGAEPRATDEQALAPVVAGSAQSAGLDDATVDLPPGAIASPGRKAPPQRTPHRPRRPANASGWRRPPLWAYVLTTALVVAIVGGVAYAIIGPVVQQNVGVHDITGCATASPCQVANSYLATYTGGKYSAMYGYTSPASRTRFSSPAILHAAASYQINPADYKNAQDYITRRTQGIVAQAQVYGMSATLGKVKQIDATHVSFPARLIMHSSSLGDMAVDISIPLSLANNAWRVDWSPGLIFPQLDDPSDPNYAHLVRLTATTAHRGTIYSADGQALAIDETDYVVGVVPAKITDANAVSQALIKNLDLTAAEVSGAYQGKDANTFWPVRTITPMLYQQVSAALNVPGIQTQQSIGRVYPFGTITAPITGYVGQVDPTEIAHDTTHYYQSGDIIGRAGVEQWGEQYLRPVKGGELDIRARNADGSDGPTLATIAARAAQNGENIYTTIDVATQSAAMGNLSGQSGHSGGAAALDPATGDVLAMASYPTYDPNDFSLGFTANEQTRFNAMDSPYLNRATMAAVPTGSIFKLVTLSAALEHGIGASQTFTCTGSYQVPGENHLRIDDAPAGHGTLTAPQAIGPSCDVIFWTVAVQLNQQDPNILPTVAKQFGFGAPTATIGLPASEDNPGIVPDPAWLKTNKNAGWSPSDAANLGIGQGFFEATPMQVASMTATLASGKRMQPLLVTKVVDANGQTIQPFAPVQVGVAPLSADNLQVVQVAMLGPIYSPGGTSLGDFAGYPVTVAGKTGTAESGQPNPHAWFVVYAPAQKLSGPPVTPKIAVATLVEFSGFGDTFAAPVSKAIVSAYLRIPVQ